MAAITPHNWAKIYAFIWKDAKTGGDYKEKFEKDPALAVKEITAILGINDYDRLYDVVVDPSFSPGQLDSIMKGTAAPSSFTFFLRLSC
jgi:hypothetical protein